MKPFLLLITILLGISYSIAQVKYTQMASGLGVITDITHAGDGSQRIFVSNKSGTITILDSTFSNLGLFLNIGSIISTSSEKGLLGLAFHPDYASNGYFFVNYNPTGTNHTVIARFTAANPSANALVDTATRKIILTITDAANGNHKAGDLAFGPDGYLYIPTGDGGGGGDPQGSGQNRNSLLGKILRLDINTTSPYLIPADNPFIDSVNTLDEIWDLGLRNPWRISFDKQTNNLWIADVGQGAREEINIENAGSGGGFNYGWNCREGFIAYNGCPDNEAFTPPVFDYQHCAQPCATAGFGNSVTGGFVYRGSKPANAAMMGYYIFADYVSRHAWLIKYEGGAITDTKTIPAMTPSGVTSFGELENGEIVAGLENGTLGFIDATAALPLRLISFNAYWVEPHVELQWRSEGELNILSYIIERSTNGKDFHEIGVVQAQSRVSSLYKFQDLRALAGKNYYRLKMMEPDGHSEYSPVSQVDVLRNNGFQAFYKASSKEIVVAVDKPGLNDQVHIYSIQGKPVQKWILDGSPLRADRLAAGVYILSLVNNGVSSVQKIMVY
jgi:glucose/arabinose dehydrogenase